MTKSQTQLMLDEIADDFLVRRRNGESPNIDDYVGQYPALAEQIKEFLATLNFIDEHKDFQEVNVGGFPQLLAREPETFPKIEDYRILRVAGRGGMGIVYEAEQISLTRRVALKVLPSSQSQDTRAVERFQTEAKSAAAFHHSNIVPVFEVGNSGDHCYYAMQFIEGQSLDFVVQELKGLKKEVEPKSEITRHLLRGDEIGSFADEPDQDTAEFVRKPVADSNETNVRHQRTDGVADQNGTVSGTTGAANQTSGAKLYPSTTLRMGNSSTTAGSRPFYRNIAKIGRQVAEALQYAHDNGIVHRDIKPANLMLDLKGTVWVTDFGLAKTEASDLTRTGDVVGTLRYMSPERFAGVCDGRSDIYSLGITLYELLALQPAFNDSNRLSLMDSIKNETPPSLRRVDAKIPHDLQTIIEKSLEKDPQRRYSNAAEFADDLGRFINDQPIHARTVGSIERLGLWARKHKALAASLATLVFFLVAGTLGSLIAAKYYRDLAGQNLILAKSNADKTMEADQRADEAVAALKQAETSQTRTNDVLDLVTNAFESVNPDSGADANMLARDVLLEIERSLESSTLDDEGRIQLLNKLTRCYLAIGEEQSAISAGEQLISLSESVLGEEDQVTIAARQNLARAYQISGRPDDAVELFTQNVNIQSRLDSDSSDTVLARGNLAGAYLSIGRRDEALAIFEENVRLDKTNFGDEHPEYLKSLKSLSLCLQHLGQFDKAIPGFEEALATSRSVLGEDHPDTLDAMNSLAVALNQNGEYEKSVEINEQVLNLSRKKLGEDHSVTLGLMSNLVVAYISLQRTDDAISTGEWALELIHARYGKTHPLNQGAMNGLAMAYKAAGRYQDAVELMEALLLLAEESMGESHPNTMAIRGNLAGTYTQLDRVKDELELREKNLKLSRMVLGEEHPGTITSMQNLATVYLRVGREKEAVSMLESVLELRRKIFGDGHVRVLSTMHALALAYQSDGRLDEAIELLEETLRLRIQSQGERQPRTISLMTHLGDTYMKADRIDEGIPMLERALELSRKSLGDTHPSTLITMHYLAGYLEQIGRFDEAESLLAENLAAQKATDPDAWMTFNVQSLYGLVLLELGKLDEAEAALNSAYSGFRRIRLPMDRGDSSIRSVLARLKKLAETQDKAEIADKWQRELDALEAETEDGN